MKKGISEFVSIVINIAFTGSSGKPPLLLLACVEPKSDREERNISKVSSEPIMMMMKGQRSFIFTNMMPFVISSTFPGYIMILMVILPISRTR